MKKRSNVYEYVKKSGASILIDLDWEYRNNKKNLDKIWSLICLYLKLYEEGYRDDFILKKMEKNLKVDRSTIKQIFDLDQLKKLL